MSFAPRCPWQRFVGRDGKASILRTFMHFRYGNSSDTYIHSVEYAVPIARSNVVAQKRTR